MNPKQKIKELLKQVTTQNSNEVDNVIKTLQTDNIMRPIKRDIQLYGRVNGRKLA